MTDSGHPYRRPTADLEFLTSHPSLTELNHRGWQLDRLPAASTGWIFAAAVLVSLISSGYAAAGLVTLGTTFAVLIAFSALRQRDRAAARMTLRITRIGLLAWMFVGICFLYPPSDPVARNDSPAPAASEPAGASPSGAAAFSPSGPAAVEAPVTAAN